MESKQRFLLALCLLSVLVLSGISSAQNALSQELPPLPFPRVPDASGRTPGQNEEVTREQKEALKRANKERQAKLKQDTDELLKLATQLKEYVDKTNENVLSLDVIKKAAEIEKLAHSVKEKMRGSY